VRYFIDPFGCVKNQVDAENMMSQLDSAGWTVATDAGDADIIIVNSCGFIESAKQESINAVLRWKKFYPDKKILLAGCLAQRYAKDLAEAMPEADGIFGNQNLSQIAEAASAVMRKGKMPDWTENAAREPAITENTGQRPLLSLPGSAYVKISEGCNNRCAFCAIPLIRGAMRCRSVPDILEECKGLLRRGVKELCIIGQDIGSYRSGNSGLPELLSAIGSLEGQFWVRLLYIHPDHFPFSILDIMENDGRFLPYFDIPFQHASPKILSAMNRRGSSETYLALTGTIRRRLPGAVIRTTFLLGFPGETDGDFAALLDFQEKAATDWMGCFTWSREEGTPAFSMKGRVSKKTALERKRIIEERQIPITEKNMDRFSGLTLEVLIEEQFECGEHDGEKLWLGRLYCQAPEVDGTAVIVDGGDALRAGALTPGKVIARRGFDLEVCVTRK
jgi:ribosomal protein S12 methylthiotransferase